MGKIFVEEAFGYNTYSKVIPTSHGNIFDLASLTKVVATTSAIMKLNDKGKMDLDEKVGDIFLNLLQEEYTGKNKGLRKEVTVRHLLTHTSGLKTI